MSEESRGIRLDLLTRGLNYHGEQLTNLLVEKNASLLSNLDFRTLNYNIFKSSKPNGPNDKKDARLQRLHEFMAENATTIFSSQLDLEKKEKNLVIRDSLETVRAELPPIESFVEANQIFLEERKRHFFDLVAPNDVLVCKLANRSEAGLRLDVLAFDPVYCRLKNRKVQDLGIKCFCPQEELPSDSSQYSKDDFLRVVILEVKMQRLLVSMKSSSNNSDINPLRLGKISNTSCSLSRLSSTAVKQEKSSERNFTEVMEKSEGFLNPLSVHHILRHSFNLNNVAHCSLLPSLQAKTSRNESAKALRQKQSSEKAFESVERGVRLFKQGNFLEAFQCLNTALKVDPINVEGLVARGALYANNGSLEKAIDDFKKALELNPKHKNGRKYVCQTLLALAKEHEKQENELEALDAFETVLQYDSDCEEALNGVKFLKSKPKNVCIKEAREIFESALKINASNRGSERDRSRKKSRKGSKKHRRRDSSSSSSSSSSISSKSDDEKKLGNQTTSVLLPDLSRPPPNLTTQYNASLTQSYNGSVSSREKSGYDKAVDDFLKNIQDRSQQEQRDEGRLQTDDRRREDENSGKEDDEKQSRKSRDKSKSKSRSRYKSSTKSPVTVPMLPDELLDQHVDEVAKVLVQYRAKDKSDESGERKRKHSSSQLEDKRSTKTTSRVKTSLRRDSKNETIVRKRQDVSPSIREVFDVSDDNDKEDGRRGDKSESRDEVESRVVRYKDNKKEKPAESARKPNKFDIALPQPVCSTSTRASLERSVSNSSSEASVSRPSSSSIMPGAKNFEDLEAMLDAAKRRRKDAMIARNKELIKKNNNWP